MELALSKGQEVPVHTVVSKGVRLALVGPAKTLARNCEQFALQVGSTGNASCVTPRKASSSDSQAYHPVVHLSLPEGLSITALLPQTKGQDACTDQNERFLSPFKVCKDCKIGFARCERELEGLELAMSEGTAVPHPVVVAHELRIAVIGPPENAKLGCRAFAADIATKGVSSASCVEPKIIPAKR